MNSTVHTPDAAPAASGLTERDLIDLSHIDDAMQAVRRRLIILDVLAGTMSNYADDIGLNEPCSKASEERAIIIIYEVERQITSLLAFADAAVARPTKGKRV